MSYSFNVKGDSKTAAILAAEDKFKAEVLANQPIHAKDEAVAFANLRAHMALATEPHEGEEVIVSMHGSISVFGDRVVGCSSGCSVYVQTKLAQR